MTIKPKQQQQQHPTIPLLLLLTILLPNPTTSQICEWLYEPSWQTFETTLLYSGGRASFCAPFIIKGPACNGNGNGFDVKSNLELICDKSIDPEGECIINCPGRHFTVMNGATLELWDGLVLQGATEGSVEVLGGGELFTYESKFEFNTNKGKNGGGAIFAEKNSFLEIFKTHFTKNRSDTASGGKNGGAIHYKGVASIRDSTFIQNKAGEDGGAIYGDGPKKKSKLVDNTFEGNQAGFFGPAVFSSTKFRTLHGNYACNNYNPVWKSQCDGVFDVEKIKCSEFDPRKTCK